MLLNVLRKAISKTPNKERESPTSSPGGCEVTILTPPHTVFLAHLVFKSLSAHGVRVSINIGEYESGFDGSHFVVLCPQIFKRLPESFIAFQMEQVGTPWFSPSYLDLLKNPRIYVLDYSSFNLPFLIEKGVPDERISVAQLAVFPNYPTFLRQQGLLSHDTPGKDFDVLFYGGINERRFNILSKLDRKFRLKVAVGVFGPPLYELISRSKTVVNIHIQNASPLESTRICESLSLGAQVVSENSPDSSDYPNLSASISLIDAGNTSGLVDAIENALTNESNVNYDFLRGYDDFSASVVFAARKLGWHLPN